MLEVCNLPFVFAQVIVKKLSWVLKGTLNFFILFYFFSQLWVSLCCPGCLRTLLSDRDLSASALSGGITVVFLALTLDFYMVLKLLKSTRLLQLNEVCFTL